MRDRMLRWIVALSAAGCVSVGAGCTGLSPQARRALEEAHKSYDEGRFDDATRKVDQFFTKYGTKTPATGEAYQLRGVAYLRLNQPRQAREDLLLATKTPDTPEKAVRAAYIALGNMDFETGQYAEAADFYENALKVFEANESPKEKVLYRYGYSLQMIGEWSKADIAFARLQHDFPNTQEGKLAAELFNHKFFYIQVGAYEKQDSAMNLQSRLSARKLPVTVNKQFSGGKLYYVVGIGQYKTYQEAVQAFEQMKPSLSQISATAIIRSGRPGI